MAFLQVWWRASRIRGGLGSAGFRKSPHSNTADLCYRRYEESVYAGFTGSSGTDIPPEIKRRLVELRGLAKMQQPDLQK